ncbi:MAG: DUF5698 domain-containing protein [Parcubacteria group bacterium]|jgi:uncharacterized protein YebE (UPF0316 family)
MTLFFVGVIEMIIVTLWTKLVVKTRVLASGMVTLVNILIWYYVLQRIVDDINNWKLVVLYAIGCATGTAISTYYFQMDEKLEAKLLEQN